MGYFINNKEVRFSDLEESGMYSAKLMEEIKKGNYHELKKMLDEDTRKDKDFMEPLLYAVKNEKGTYAIFECYHERLQDNVTLATDIIKREPELIKNTPVSKNKDFIMSVAEVNPKVVQYMSEELKQDGEFTAVLCNLQVDEITQNVAQECKMPDVLLENAELAANKEFMIQVILQDANSLKYAEEELKNDYEFMKEASENEEVIEYVVEHTEQFGQKGLEATKDVVFEKSTDRAISGFEEENKKVKEQISQKQSEGQSEGLEELLKRDKQLQRHTEFFKRIQKGEIDSVRATKLIDKICVNLDEQYRKQIKQYLKLDEAILEKHKEQEHKKDEKPEIEVSLENVEELVNENTVVTTSGIREETDTIRKVIMEQNKSQIKETGEERQ